MSDKKSFIKILSAVILVALITAVALTVYGCTNTNNEHEAQVKTFTFISVDENGTEHSVMVTTEEKTVGAALLKEGIIENNTGAYGTYVKTVFGILADYNTTGTYWAFYINDEYSLTGVDSTPITDGATYALKIEK